MMRTGEQVMQAGVNYGSELQRPKDARESAVFMLWLNRQGFLGSHRLQTSGKLSFLQHYFCGFDHRGNCVADLELQFFGATAGDDALDLIVADFHDDVGHDVPELKLHDFADQTVASG
jgi:hypothetical protein